MLARKWRPQTFDEIVGQTAITQTLANAIRLDRLAHAYVFSGLRGTGKTTAARILAKCLNCESGPNSTPCGTCAPCQEIADSRCMDVLELDAASRTSVDNIRELQEVISFAPARDRYKILIIDEAHMLSKAAFNALLKTLEEPPPNVLFILATTEIQKVLPTILSRCQVFEFRRVDVREMVGHLRRICEAEKVTISDAALDRIARAGEGSVRDSLSTLEQVLAFCGTEIDDDALLRILGGVRSAVLTDLTRGLAQRDGAAMLAVLDGLVDEGHDLLHFWGEWIATLRDLLLMRTLDDATPLLSRAADEAAALLEAADGLSIDDLNRSFQIVADLEHGLKTSSRPRFLFEAALIRLAGLGSVRPIEEVLASLETGAIGGSPQRPTPPPARASAPGSPPRREPEKKKPVAVRPLNEATLLQAIRDERPAVGAMLAQGATLRLEEGVARVEFAGPTALAGRLGSAETTDWIAGMCERRFGASLKWRVTSSAAAGDAAPATETSTPTAPLPRADPTPTSDEPSREELIQTAKKEPAVHKLLREFGAQIVDIRPLEESPTYLEESGIDETEETR
ncbi:MAG: DNA polymerase III subunit gamma/tau [Acidobacteriota bacterium]|nr:DNA polymerase III subunit gamma/tau [Acidobacteriota bacterium]MDH3784875.1 DNA polymerase III subunit gamma/tau [Acidobacteriota bacterium]